MRSVRARVTLLGVVVVALALAVSGFVLRLTMERQLTTSGDDLSRSRARELAELVTSGSIPAQLGSAGEDGVAQIVAADRSVLGASSNIAGQRAIASFQPSGIGPVVRTLRAPDDTETETYRVWGVTANGPAGRATVYVGRSLESVHEAVASLTRALTIGLPVLTLLLALAMWLLVGRALRPVELLREEVASISPRELDRRLAVPATKDEVSRLAVTMNDMLGRLNEAAERERDFVGNASHELLSPIASFRTQLEVALAHPAAADWSGMSRELLDDSLGMERLVKDLLFLARADADELVLHTEPVDLSDVVRAQVAQVPGADAVSVVVEGTGDLAAADREALSRLVRNLLDNAVRHAHSKVLVELVGTSLVVSDDGPGVPPEHRERVFDRFFQADQARSRQVPGAGLGLAIARSIAERHGGTLLFAGTSRLGGADFVLTLPRAEPHVA